MEHMFLCQDSGFLFNKFPLLWQMLRMKPVIALKFKEILLTMTCNVCIMKLLSSLLCARKSASHAVLLVTRD
jgi:uncharacterized membrane protein